MGLIALHPNDAGITLLDAARLYYRQPGFALLVGDQLELGDAAFRQARIDPRGIQHRYWATLSPAPIDDRRFSHLSAADLVSRHLEQLWADGPGGELVMAVPGYWSNDQLGLLLGIAEELGIRTVALVDAAVAATRREYRNATPVHIDIGLHATTLCRIGQHNGARVEQTEVIEDCGIQSLYDGWLRYLAEAFVQQSRFDPLHTAETEQALLGRMLASLASVAHAETVNYEIDAGGLSHRAEIESLALVNAVAPQYQQIASRLRALLRAGETPVLQVTDRVARLPGLTGHLAARVGGEVFALEPGATARGALARLSDAAAASGGLKLKRELPWDQAAFEVDDSVSSGLAAGTPTHLLFDSTAYAIDSSPLVLGSQPGSEGRVISLGTDMPGVSRLHCRILLDDGRCVVDDQSRYGTFLNGHRISGSTVLQIGDTLRVGSPGYEFRMITTDESHGA